MRPDGELEAQGALDVLGDLAEWRLTAAGWAAATTIVERLAAAVGLNIAAIRAAIADSELASPLRLTELGPSLVAPPPRRLRLIRNRLIHMFVPLPGSSTSAAYVRTLLAATQPVLPYGGNADG